MHPVVPELKTFKHPVSYSLCLRTVYKKWTIKAVQKEEEKKKESKINVNEEKRDRIIRVWSIKMVVCG
jgi:UDP-2,3-diacylglucosamine pyrophosphatase LpxH